MKLVELSSGESSEQLMQYFKTNPDFYSKGTNDQIVQLTISERSSSEKKVMLKARAIANDYSPNTVTIEGSVSETKAVFKNGVEAAITINTDALQKIERLMSDPQYDQSQVYAYGTIDGTKEALSLPAGTKGEIEKVNWKIVLEKVTESGKMRVTPFLEIEYVAASGPQSNLTTVIDATPFVPTQQLLQQSSMNTSKRFVNLSRGLVAAMPSNRVAANEEKLEERKEKKEQLNNQQMNASTLLVFSIVGGVFSLATFVVSGAGLLLGFPD